jgi:DNA-binding PadR family transcriptional regulator
VLETAGLIAIEKGYAGKRARTWVTLTKAGQAALEDEIAQLKLLISRFEPRRLSDAPSGGARDCQTSGGVLGPIP